MVKYFRDVNSELAEAVANMLSEERAQEVVDSITPDRMARLVANIARNPQAPAALQLATIDEPDEVRDMIGTMWAEQASARAALRPDQPNMWERTMSAVGGLQDFNYEAIKTGTRFAQPALDIGPQTVQAEFRNAVGDPRDRGVAGIGPSLRDAYGVFFDRDELSSNLRERFESELAPGQAAQVDGGDVYDLFFERNPINQTDLGQLGREAVTTGGIDTSDHGNGFFISQESQHVARRRLAERVPGTLADGQTVTAGRWLSETAGFDPESTKYNILSGTVDGAVAIFTPSADNFADPAIAAGGRQVVRRLGGSSPGDFLQTVGGYRGSYKMVDPERARNFINGDAGNRIVNWLAETDSWEAIYRRSNGQYPPALVSRLQDTSDPDVVRALLLDGFENSATAPVFQSGVGAWAGRRTAGWRIAGDMPDRMIDFTDARQSVDVIDDFARNVNASRPMRAAWLEEMGRAPNVSARRTAYHQILSDTAQTLETRYRLPAGRGDELTQYMIAETDTGRVALNDLIRWSKDDWNRLSNGEEAHTLPALHILAERAEVLPMPNARDLRQATGVLYPLYETVESPYLMERLAGVMARNTIGEPLKFASSVLTQAQGAWKTSRLLRGAYTLRVVGEEQFRIGQAGYSSAFRHPISYIADLVSVKNADDLTGQLLRGTDEFRAARVGSRPASFGYPGGGAPGRTHRTVLGRDTALREPFIKAWQDEILTLASDPIAQRIARANNNDEVMMWLIDPDAGGRYLRELRDLNPEFINSERMVRSYLDSVSNRMAAISGSNDDILQVFRRGPTSSSVGRARGERVWSESFELDDLVDTFAPERLATVPELEAEHVSALNKVVDGAFELLATRPTNNLSRSPVFVQAYRAATVELAPLASDTRALAEAAEATGLFRPGVSNAGLPDNLARLVPDFGGDDAVRLIQNTTAQGRLTVAQIDELAKASALKTVQDLLYDVSRSSQFFDTYRLLFPFGEAWKEAFGTWARLIKDSPASSLRRVGQAHAAVNDSGIFHENANGQTVFGYPGTEQLTGAGAGAPFPMEGSISGLNMMGEIYPGVGPVVAYPAHWFLPDESSWNGIRDVVMPFGEPGDPRDVGEWIAPSWARTAFWQTEPFTEEDQRRYGNTQMHVMRYMMSTGEYDMTTEEGLAQLLEESRSRTTRMFLLRGLVQFFAPSSPQVVPQVIGPDGELAETQALLDRFYDLSQQDYDTAVEKFMAEVGMDNLLLIGKNTQPTVHGGVPLNGDGYEWVQDNPEAKENHPQLYGFFAPQTPGGDFNYDAYKRALRNGDIEQLDGDEKLRLANHRIASTIYRNYRTQAQAQATAAGFSAIRPESAEFLENLRIQLRQDWPGYREAATIANLLPVWEVMDDVERALDDELLMSTPAGEGLAEYWRQRQTVLDVADRAGIDTSVDNASGWRTSNELAAQRLWLTNVGDTIAAANPDFAVMWDTLLSREIEDYE